MVKSIADFVFVYDLIALLSKYSQKGKPINVLCSFYELLFNPTSLDAELVKKRKTEWNAH